MIARLLTKALTTPKGLLTTGVAVGVYQLGKHLYNTRMAPNRIAQRFQDVTNQGVQVNRMATQAEQQVLRQVTQRFSRQQPQGQQAAIHVGRELVDRGKTFREYTSASGAPIALAEVIQAKGQQSPQLKVLAHAVPTQDPQQPRQWYTRASGSVLRRLWYGDNNPAFVRANPRHQVNLDLASLGMLPNHAAPPPPSRYTQIIPQNHPERAGLEQGRRYVQQHHIGFHERLEEGFRDGGRNNPLSSLNAGRREVVRFAPSQDSRLNGLYQQWANVWQQTSQTSEYQRLRNLTQHIHHDVANGATSEIRVQNSDNLQAGREYLLGEIIDGNAAVCRHYTPIVKGFMDRVQPPSQTPSWQTAMVRGHYSAGDTQGGHAWDVVRTPQGREFIVDAMNNHVIQISGAKGWFNRNLGAAKGYQTYE
jgi:hypothetical protein